MMRVGLGPRRAQTGAVVIEAVVSISGLVIALAVVMQILATVFKADEMDRAAQAAAQSLALDKTILGDEEAMANRACEAIRNELDKESTFDCWGAWTKKIDPNVAPSDLPKTLERDPTGTNGDMVLVRIEWGTAPNSGIAMGLARAEP